MTLGLGALTYGLLAFGERGLGYSATAAGASLLPFVLLMSLLSRWSGGLISSFDARGPLTVGPLVVAAGFGW